MMRAPVKPSAFTSPAPLTERPNSPNAESPSNVYRTEPSKPENTRALPELRPLLSSKTAPTMRSAKPSPSTSPAPLTEEAQEVAVVNTYDNLPQ